MSEAGSGAPLVLVVGDANPDLILTGDIVPRFGQAEQLLDQARLTIGGSAAITAHALARLGRPVALCAAVGTDAFARQLCDQLAAAGVDLSALLRRAEVPTGLTVVLAHPHDRAILTLPGAIPTLSADDVARAVAARRGSGLAHVHVSSLYLQPGLAAELPTLLALLRAQGVSTSLDTNDDPTGEWLGLENLLPYLDLLLPNRSEVMAIGRRSDPLEAATAIAEGGPLVVVKDGPAGAFAVSPSGELTTARATPATALDTTGAGDTFNAAFIDSWLDSRTLDESLRRAVLAGAFAVTALGGTAAQPTRDDLTDPDLCGRT